MKLQHIAIIFLIIILPISLALSQYTKSQARTLQLQADYDSKLDSATYDAVKSYQMNSANSDTSDIPDSKIRDIEASINVFFNSISNAFRMEGYDKEILSKYVPAIVYTMYDGMYIYTSYNNTLDDSINLQTDSTYKKEEQIQGLKPYIYYSCRYKKGSIDVVITYSMDNFVQVDGMVANGKYVHKSGYLYNTGDITKVSENTMRYNGINIDKESAMQEDILGTTYTYVKLNGVKYYYDASTGSWFSLMNGEKIPQQPLLNYYQNNNDLAYRYFKEAKDFSDWFFGESGLGDLTPNDAYAEDGRKISETVNEPDNNEYGLTTSIKSHFLSTSKIFDGDIENKASNFNNHRLSVIRYTIEKNLSIAIQNYNTFTGGASAEFQMPSLTEEEWASLLNNMSVISFLQGLSIGGRIYNGYSVVSNNLNKEVVTEDSIYIVGSDNNYHKVTDKDLVDGTVTPVKGYLNTDFERRIVDDQYGSNYFYARKELGCYGSISGYINLDTSVNDIQVYMQNNPVLAKVYYTGLARERYSAFKANRVYDNYLNNFLETP